MLAQLSSKLFCPLTKLFSYNNRTIFVLRIQKVFMTASHVSNPLCCLDFNYCVLSLGGHHEKNLQNKNFGFCKQKMFRYYGRTFSFLGSEKIMFWWISNWKIAKRKYVFCHFWPLEGIRIKQKHCFWIQHIQFPLFWPLIHLCSPLDG